MSTPFIGEIRMVGFNFPPRGWAFCNGAVMSIGQNQALFAILGTTYGGNGQTTFALPNLQTRVPVYVGQGISLGQQAGEANHTLINAEMPLHTHPPVGGSPAAVAVATGSLPGKGTSHPFYAPTPNTAMNPATVSTVGNNAPHNNMPPYLVVNFCIALVGIFPSRN